jgi:hypothetical protein
MKLLRGPAILALILAFNLSANEIDGTWKAWFVGPVDNLPKMVSEMVFDLKAEGNKLTGSAHMGNWPGDAPISDGKINGDRISFTAIGKRAWNSRGPGWRSSGYPRLKFVGLVRGTEVKLSLIWDNILIYGTHGGDPSDFEMVGKKIPEAR